MTWAAFSGNGRTQLYVVKARMDANTYTAVLQSQLLPVEEQIAGPFWIFQQDNASVHRVKKTWEFLQHQRVQLLQWPALSLPISIRLRTFGALWFGQSTPMDVSTASGRIAGGYPISLDGNRAEHILQVTVVMHNRS